MGGCFADTDGQEPADIKTGFTIFYHRRGPMFPRDPSGSWRARGPAAGHACGPGFGLPRGSVPRGRGYGFLPIGPPTTRRKD